MKSCITCGMPLKGNHVGDIGLEVSEGLVCKFDSENGNIKNGKEIFEGGVNFFTNAATEGNRELATRITRKNMKSLRHWQQHPFEELIGPEATEDEFQTAMAKL